MPNDIVFTKIDTHSQDYAQNLARLNFFLKRHGQTKAAKGDLNFYLEKQQQIIASARLIATENGYWLRGVYVDETLRHQGLGSQLIREAHATLDKTSVIYAFPLAHLEHFYQSLGYQTALINTFPESLQVRFKSAQAQNKNWLSMVFKPSGYEAK